MKKDRAKLHVWMCNEPLPWNWKLYLVGGHVTVFGRGHVHEIGARAAARKYAKRFGIDIVCENENDT